MIPLNIEKYLAAFKPIEILSKTGNGTPCFWDKLPIKFERRYTRIEAKILPDKTIKKFKSYIIYNDAIRENPIRL